jgi:phosphatidylglycerol lysyltransferase
MAARVVGVQLSAAFLIRCAWVANTFNNLIGLSGLAGSGIRYLLLSREGVEGRTSAVYSGIILLSIPAGLAVLTWSLFISGSVLNTELPLAPWIIHLALGGFALFLPAYLLILRSETLRRRFVPGSTRPSWLRLASLIGISLLDWLLAVAVAWACVFLTGAEVPIIDFALAFILAAVLGILSLVPGGLGVFDATLLVLLGGHSQATATEVLAGLVVFRVVYYFVPWLIGVYLSTEILTAADRWQSSRWVRYWQDSTGAALLRLPLGMLSAIGVRTLAYLTFGAGVILLISAAYPTVTDRLAVLDRYLPLAAIEASHLLSVVVGVLLIAVSRGIADQVGSAYRVTISLLFSGALFSLIKGIDYEEALILLVVAGALRLQKKNFYRQAASFKSMRTVYWLLSMLVAVLGFMGLGAWIHGEIPFQLERLLLFAPTLEAPRFARSLLLASLVIVVFLAWSLFRSARPVLKCAAEAELAEAKTVLDAHGGSSFAHLVFLGDKHLYWPPQRHAFIQYATIRDRLVALGDPCGDVNRFDEVILGFREFADVHDLVPVFYEVADQHAYRYHDAGFALFKLGEMAYVELEQFTLAGKRGESLRHSFNRAKREGLSFELWQPPFDNNNWQTLKNISDTWLQHLGAAEKSFSLGSYQESYLSLAPIAVVKHADKAVAFANLMPDYALHQELSIDLMRYAPGAPPGTMDYLFVELLQWAKAQNYRYFNLGMAPLAGVGEARFARPQERLARLAFEYGNRFYNYKGLRSFKEKFHPQWRSHYLAYPVFTPLPALLLDTAALVAGGYKRIFFRLD